MESNEFVKEIGELNSRIDQLYKAFAKKKNINYHALNILYCAYKNEYTTQKAIAYEWSVPKQTINTVAKQLFNKGIISYSNNLEDKRELSIVLTDKGREIAKPIIEQLATIEENVCNILGERADTLMEIMRDFCIYFEEQLKNDKESYDK